MRPRRVPREHTAASSWLEQRDQQIARAIRCGLGIRPEGWWRFESSRPELAGSAADDLYAHLRDDPEPYLLGAVERLRHLRVSGELRPAEIAAIHHGAATEREPGRYAWRSRVLREAN